MSQSTQLPKTNFTRPIFYPTRLKSQVLENLANYYCLTVRDLAALIYSQTSPIHEASLRRALTRLDRDGLVNRISYRPDHYPGYGGLPFACGLSDEGYRWAKENCPWTDPKQFVKDHSPLTLEHEIKRARFHTKIQEMCDYYGYELFWKKTDLKHTVEPDDVFAIRQNGNIAYYFFELENKRKQFKDLLEKYRRYEEYYGTDRCKEEWKDFRTFHVVTQIRSEEARQNILHFLSGKPIDIHVSGKRHTIINRTPIQSTTFWFTTDELVAADVGNAIFLTPKDFEANVAYSLAPQQVRPSGSPRALNSEHGVTP